MDSFPNSRLSSLALSLPKNGSIYDRSRVETPIVPPEASRSKPKSRLRINGVPVESPKPSITNDTPILDAAQLLIPPMSTWATTFNRSIPELAIISDTISKRVLTEGHFLPDTVNLFKAFELTPLDKVRVVVIGQDPYPALLPDGRPRAQGLAFSVQKGDSIPGSLRNIFVEIQKSYPQWPMPENGDLTKWAIQGLFLLNICLTCPPNNAGGHAKYMVWFPFILKVLEDIARVRPNCIYVLWGAEAMKIRKYVGEKSILLTAAHPSPMSAQRGFFGCGHFKQINDLLEQMGEPIIQW